VQRRRIDVRTVATKTGSRTDRGRGLFPTRGALVIAMLVCVVAPTILVALQIDANRKFSPVDEAAHFDYVDRVANGEVPRQGQHLLKSTLREVACRGNALEAVKVPPCTAPTLEYEQFPGAASQYEAQQPPTYYALTVPLRWVAQHVFRIRDTLDATRATGIAWLVAGLLLLWAAGRVMNIDPRRLGATLLLLVAAPTVVFFTGTVSNDVTAIPAAGLVALIAALAYRRDGPRVPIALFLAGFVAAACKTTNLFAVVAVSALFAVAAITTRATAERWTATLRRWLSDGGALLLGGATSAGVWVIIHQSIALIDLKDEPAFKGLRAFPHTFGVVLGEATALFQPLTGDVAVSLASSGTLGQDVQKPLYAALSFVLISAGLAGMFVSPRRWSHVLGLIVVPMLYVGGVVFGLGLTTIYQIDPGLSGRYGLSLAALLILVLAASVAGTWPKRVIAGLAVAMFLTTLAVMAT
jgi:hypothetical protein